jgi:hypothetical protein
MQILGDCLDVFLPDKSSAVALAAVAAHLTLKKSREINHLGGFASFPWHAEW